MKKKKELIEEVKEIEVCDSCGVCDECSDGKKTSYSCIQESKKKIKVRLNRIEGQIRGINNMIENDTHCNDVLNQIASVKAALGGVAKVILENHLNHCVVNEIKNGKEEKSIKELMQTLDKIFRL